ncbi:MAG: DUF1820 family protein [Gammaproteobacteria bacterium]|nr:DUF1820 family protein [Gammaproteobacteria bacterium]MDE0251578.1 DUF1820 family protein [Gammaproteobacteria bacterium]MDE0403412.1 DUF1820 family protein [Gammaproteobacteria bacterium]MXX95835.1 DUF1820 family protein [Gammaproteobacteria bacterium]MYF53220.1 DUF1820 family protein [Gammaproteobacteria bacterium]
MTSQIPKHIYRVQFHNAGKIYEVYVREVKRAAHLFGFVELRSFMFRKPTQVVIDPTEDKLRNEFGEVEGVFVPVHAIVRIDEVKRAGTAKIKDTSESNVTPFPGTVPDKRGSS